MKRSIDLQIRRDLQQKMVLLTGPRQVGKTTLSQQLLAEFPGGQYLNFDVAAHRAVIQAQTWRHSAPLLVLDEIHKMPDWKNWLKGVVDGRAPGQALLVTGSARMDTFRQTGASLAGRYFRLRLHPLSVREWSEASEVSPQQALTHLLARGGFPEPVLASTEADAQRWRADYFAGLVREDVLEFSRLHEVNAMRLFAEMLRSRVGSPLSLASMARDLQLSPVTLGRYLDILEALFIVFVPNLAEEISKAIPGAIFGVILILFMFFAPGGIASLLSAQMRRMPAKAGRAFWIISPSSSVSCTVGGLRSSKGTVHRA
jgi:predicted AAA+ superfamily ATPase